MDGDDAQGQDHQPILVGFVYPHQLVRDGPNQVGLLLHVDGGPPGVFHMIHAVPPHHMMSEPHAATRFILLAV